MGKICKFKDKIIDAIVEHYDDVANVGGCDLDELGKWIDICKDIEEMRYYEYMAKKTKDIIDAMDDKHEDGSRSFTSVVQSLENMIKEGLPDMSDEEVMKHKKKLEQIIAEM